MLDENASFIGRYWGFLVREQPISVKGFDTMPNFIRDTVACSGMFCTLFLIFPYVCSFLFPKWWKELNTPLKAVANSKEELALEKNRIKKRVELPAYAVCLVNHFVVVPLSWYQIYQDVLLSTAAIKIADYAVTTAWISPFGIGYLVGDTIFFAIPAIFRRDYAMIIHHCLTLTLIFVTLNAGNGSILRFIPHLFISDTANLFFNIAWILGITPFKDGVFKQTLEYLFLIAYFFLRVIHLPLVFISLFFNETNLTGLGVARYVVIPIAAMQWYWFAIIIKSSIKRLGSNNSTKSNTKSE